MAGQDNRASTYVRTMSLTAIGPQRFSERPAQYRQDTLSLDFPSSSYLFFSLLLILFQRVLSSSKYLGRPRSLWLRPRVVDLPWTLSFLAHGTSSNSRVIDSHWQRSRLNVVSGQKSESLDIFNCKPFLFLFSFFPAGVINVIVFKLKSIRRSVAKATP